MNNSGPSLEWVKFLKSEWRTAGFDLFPEEQMNEKLIEEVHYACAPPPHEGHSPKYGAFLVSAKPERILIDEAQHHLTVEVNDARELADGEYSFFVRSEKDDFVLVLRNYFGDEYGAYKTRDEYLKPFGIHIVPPRDIGIVQRCSNGQVRVFGPRNVATRQNERWSVRQYKYSYVNGIEHAIRMVGEEIATIRELMALSVHLLSANGTGATLVMKRDDSDFLDVSPLSNEHYIESPGYDLGDSRFHRAIAQVLSQKDGAVLLRSSGDIDSIGMSLDVDGSGENMESGGSRHKSARAYSRKHEDCLVVVVSSQGGVTVFFSGQHVEAVDPLGNSDADT